MRGPPAGFRFAERFSSIRLLPVRRRNVLSAIVASALTGAGAMRAVAGTSGRLSLIMVDRAGCAYCAAWKREILPGYVAHPTGRILPLTLVPLDGPWPDGIALDRAPAITPTFVLLDGPVEIARIEGYPGARHFWPEVETLLARTRSQRKAPR